MILLLLLLIAGIDERWGTSTFQWVVHGACRKQKFAFCEEEMADCS